MRTLHRFACAAAVLCGILLFPQSASAYSYNDDLWLTYSGTQINMSAATTKDPWDSWGHWYCQVWSQIGNWCDEAVVIYDRPYVETQVYDSSAQLAYSGAAVDDPSAEDESLAVLTWQRASPSDGTWNEASQHYIEYDHYYTAEWGGFLSCITFSFMAASASSVNVTGGGGSTSCDPAVTALINDYAACAANTFVPANKCTINLGPLQCADFSQTRSNNRYSAAQLGNWAANGVNWGLVNDNMIASGGSGAGLEWALLLLEVSMPIHYPNSNFATPYTLNSAYRTPRNNVAAGGVAGSYHMSGNAADIGNPSCTPLGSRQNCRLDVWQTIDDIAHIWQLTDYYEPVTLRCQDDCYHFDYRNHGGDYQ
jgi:hypothetical protein